MKFVHLMAFAPTVFATYDLSSYYEPGIIVALSTEYFNDNQDFIYRQLIDYLNDSYSVEQPSWTQVEFPFLTIHVSNFMLSNYEYFMEAPKSITLKGSCGAAGKARPGEVAGGLDPDVVVQQSCVSGLISTSSVIEFKFDYSTRIGIVPYMGTATVQLHDVAINYQFRPYSELHKHRFVDGPIEEEHPGGQFALAFDRVHFSTSSVNF
jgi:hypothetical protein